MKTEVIVNPLNHPYDEMLVSIETSPDAFTEGRRNNDMVNWFLMKRIIDINQFEGTDRSLAEMERDYLADFDRLEQQLSADQKDCLNSWRESSGYRVFPEDKITRFVQYYGKIRNTHQLANLWLPMEYGAPGQPENQLTLLTEEG